MVKAFYFSISTLKLHSELRAQFSTVLNILVQLRLVFYSFQYNRTGAVHFNATIKENREDILLQVREKPKSVENKVNDGTTMA